MIPSLLSNESIKQAHIIKRNISDLQRIDERVKIGIRSIKERLKVATNSNCSTCPLLQSQVMRKDQHSKEKDRRILNLNLKIDRISQQNNHFSGAHSSRKADLQSKREALTRNAKALLSERKAPIHEIYKIQERLPLQMEKLWKIQQRTQLLRSKEKSQRQVIKRLNSINKQHTRFQYTPSRQSDSKNQEQDAKLYLPDDTLRNFKERLASLSPYIEDENTSEFQGASFTSINDKCHNINILISDLKNSNQTLIGRNSFLEKELNKFKEQIIIKDTQLLKLKEQKLAQENQTMNKMAELSQTVQILQRQHQGCKHSIEHYLNKSSSLEETLAIERHKYEQQLSTQTEELIIFQGKLVYLERAKSERDELKVQVKDQVIRRLTLIEQINLLNKQNYSLKLNNSSFEQKTEDLNQQNSQLKKLLNDRNEETQRQRSQHKAKMIESEQIRNSLEILFQQLKQQNLQLKLFNNRLSEESKGTERQQTNRLLQQKIKNIQNQLYQKEKAISQLKGQVNKLNKTIEQQANLNKSSQSDINVYRLEISILTQKCDYLNAQLDQLKDSSQKKLKAYSEQLSSTVANMERIKSESLKKDVQLKTQMSQKEYLSQQNQKLKQLLQQLKQKLQQSKQETDELREDKNRFKKQNQLLQDKMMKLNKESQANNAQSETIIEQLMNINKSNETQIGEISEKLTIIKVKNKQQQSSIQDLKEKIIIAQKQVIQAQAHNQILSLSIQTMQKANQQLKTIVEVSLLQKRSNQEKISSLQETVELISASHQNQLKFFMMSSQSQQRQISNLKSLIQEKANKLERHKQQIKQVQLIANEQISKFKKQLEKECKSRQQLLDQIRQRQLEINKKKETQIDLIQKIQDLTKENQRIQSQMQKIIEQSRLMQNTQASIYDKQKSEMLNIIRQQSDRLIAQIKIKYQKLIQSLKKQHENVINALKKQNQIVLNTQVKLKNEYQRNLLQIGFQVQGLQDKLKDVIQVNMLFEAQLNNKALKIDETTKQLYQEKEAVRIVNQDKELLMLKLQQSQRNSKDLILKLTQSGTKVQQTQILRQKSQQILQQINRNLNNYKQNIQALTQQAQQFKTTINMKQAQIFIVQTQISRKNQQINQKDEQIRLFEQKLAEINHQIELQNAKIQHLEKQVHQLKKQKQSYQKIVNQQQQNIQLAAQKQRFIYRKIEQMKKNMQQMQTKLSQYEKRYIWLQQQHFHSNSELNDIRVQLQAKQNIIKQHQQMFQTCQRQHTLAIQMLQHQIHERQVEIEHKDYKYLSQITNKNQRVQLLEKQLQQTKRVLQEQVLERQTQITLKQSQLVRISSNLKKQIEVLKRDSDEVKRILQLQLIQRQTQISEKDLKIIEMQAKNEQELYALKIQNEQAKRVLQQQIVEREAEISGKDLKMRQMELSHLGQLNKFVVNYEEEKRLLQQQMIQRQAAIVQYDLQLNETIITHQKQKHAIVQQYEGSIKSAEQNQQNIHKINEQLYKQMTQIMNQSKKLKEDIKVRSTVISNFQEQVQKLRESNQNAQRQSSQYLQKVKILEKSLVQKQNMILQTLNENEDNLSLALQYVHVKQTSQIEHQRQESLCLNQKTDIEVQTTQMDQSRQQHQDSSIKLRFQQLESSISNINTSYQQSLEQLQRKVNENSELKVKLQQKMKQLNNSQSKAAGNQKRYQQTQGELLELQSIFINHKISLEQLKLQNKTLKERLQQYQKQALFRKNQKKEMIIDESEELFQEMIEEVIKKYQLKQQTEQRKIDQYHRRLQSILLKLSQIKRYLLKGRKKVYDVKGSCKTRQEQLQRAAIQICHLKDENYRLHNELSLTQLTSGQIILQKDEQISHFHEEVDALKARLQVMEQQANRQETKINQPQIELFNQDHFKILPDYQDVQEIKALPLIGSPMAEIEEEEGEALITEIGSGKKMNLLLVSEISQALSQSEKNDDIEEILSSSSPYMQKSLKSESSKILGSSWMSMKSTQSAKEREKQHNQRMKTSAMMAKLRKRK